ncbi:MAG: NADH-quinone oxidoreductase subunit C [Puniceicoccaceae bacterium]
MNTRTQTIQEAHPYLTERESADWPAYNCPQEEIVGLLRYLRDEHDFDFLSDLTVIDHFDKSPRFEVVYHVYSTERHEYLRLVTPCAGETDPICPSVVDLWATADWHEREAFDMFGIQFEGHPDLRRILMWDSYPYHPLRKEFPLAGKEVEFPDEDLVEATGKTVEPAPMMGGPFHASQTGSMVDREPRADDESWNEHNERRDTPGEDSGPPRELRGKH